MMRDRRKKTINTSCGFTLIEMLLAMVISSIIFAAVYTATMEGHRASTGIEQKIAVQEDVRAALDIMAMEIGMASYNPNRAHGLWRMTNCNTAGNDSYKGIQTAANFDRTITVEADLNANGTIQIADPNEIITYNYDTNAQLITRNSNCGGAQSFIGDVTTATNRQRNVRVINQDLGIPLFRYFDSVGNEITTANLPTNIPQIRRIDITIAVIAADPDIQGQVRQIIHTTSVIPRNHAVSVL